MITYNPIPILFNIAKIKIHSWGVLVAFGIFISTLLAARYIKKKGKDSEIPYGITIYAILGGVLGSRLLYILLHFGYYLKKPLEIFMIYNGGVSSYGGIFGALLAIYLYLRFKKVDFLEYMDLMAPYMILGFGIGRIGCFLNWDDYGIASNLPWAVKVGNDVARHPTQLYHSLADFLIFFILLKFRKNEKPKGYMFYLLLFLYFVFRFIVEIFRENNVLLKSLSLSFCAIVAIVAFILLKRLSKA